MVVMMVMMVVMMVVILRSVRLEEGLCSTLLLPIMGVGREGTYFTTGAARAPLAPRARRMIEVIFIGEVWRP